MIFFHIQREYERVVLTPKWGTVAHEKYLRVRLVLPILNKTINLQKG